MKTLALLLPFIALPVFAQPDWVLGVKKWTGTITASANNAETDITGGKHSFSMTLTGTFELTVPTDDSPYSYEGKLTQTSINIKYTGTGDDGCPYVDVYEASGPTDDDEPSARLTTRRDNWVFSGGIYRLTSNLTRTHSCPPPTGKVVTVYEETTVSAVMSLPTVRSYPSSGPSLSQSGSMPIPINVGPALYNITAQTPFEYTLTLNSGEAEELELELFSPDYLTWRPKTTADEGDGEPIEFTATLKSKSGGVPQQKIETLAWELIETSREPGVAINWPEKPGGSKPDLYFKDQFSIALPASREPVGEEGQKVVVTFLNSDGTTDKIKVYPRDWGAWSTLRATATLQGGKKLTGRYRAAAEDDARLPDRDSGKFVARAWLKEKGISGADRDDLEDLPEGDGNKGDGLTLYEEYRGFYEDGQHQEADPKRKDYFAVNLAGAPGRGGLSHFQRLTGLTVHGKLTREELSEDRTVNHNFSASPRLGSQHGVVIEVHKEFEGYAKAESSVDRPSTPRDIEFVGLPENLPSRPTASPALSYASVTVAHELLHTVNVYHHGESDEDVLWTRSPDGKLYEQATETQDDGNTVAVGLATEIRAFLESGEDVTGRVRTGLRNLGHENGQHSGWENCVLRYDVADSYLAASNATDRYVGIQEIPGARLCDTTEGIAVNQPGRNPQSRYGPAASGRGVCKLQILVNDLVNPPTR